jgi:hypothetical protein
MTSSAYEKLGEAEYFLRLMKKDWSAPGFDYNLSAFLSALTSSVEHNRLFIKDPRFPEWYRQAVEKYLGQQVWNELKKFRRKEVHFKGSDTWQHISIPFFKSPPEAERPVSISWSIDLSAPGPTQEVEVIIDGDKKVPATIEKHYAWDPNGLHIIETCEAGIQIVRTMLKEYTGMRFDS